MYNYETVTESLESLENNYKTNDKYGKVWDNRGPQKGGRQHQGVSPFKYIYICATVAIALCKGESV